MARKIPASEDAGYSSHPGITRDVSKARKALMMQLRAL